MAEIKFQDNPVISKKVISSVNAMAKIKNYYLSNQFYRTGNFPVKNDYNGKEEKDYKD